MKKLIALAVAAAAMPALADVTISGATRVEFVDSANKTAGVTGTTANKEEIVSNNSDVNVSASSELNNGMTISATVALTGTAGGANTDGDGSLKIVGAFGTVQIGDVASALDAVDGAAIATARDDLSANTATDGSILYTLPTFVEGLALHAGYAAENGGTDGVDADSTSVSATYTIGGFSAFVGQVADGTSANADIDGYGVAYTTAGFTVGYNASEVDGGDEKSGVSAGYVMGDLTLAVNTQETKSNTGSVKSDQQTVSIAYNLGGGATAYVSSIDDDKAQSDSPAVSYEDVTRVGISYSF